MCGAFLIDMAESRSPRRAVPVDSQDRADPGNKKTRSRVCLKIILLQQGEFKNAFFTVRKDEYGG